MTYRRPHASRRHQTERGFTLIELLVVIVILGILSAVVVFAVRGAGNKGKDAAVATDARTIRTAQEAYCAKAGHYATMEQLTGADFANDQVNKYKFLSEESEYHVTAPGDDPAVFDKGNCPGQAGFTRYRLECRNGVDCGLTTPPVAPPLFDPQGSREGRWQAGAANRLISGKASGDGNENQENHIVLEGTVAECGSRCGMVLSIAPQPPGLVILAIVQLYDPKDGVNGRWIPVANAPSLAYKGPEPLLLKGSFEECGVNCGKVLVRFIDGNTDSWYLYHPGTGTWTPAGRPYYQERLYGNPPAVLLTGGTDKCGENCGKVLVRGGGGGELFPESFDSYYSAELYDPFTNTWALTSPCADPLEQCRPLPFFTDGGAVRLPDGRVATGGISIYDPKDGPRGKWTTTVKVGNFTGALVLPNDRVLVDNSFFDPETLSFSDAGGCPGCPIAPQPGMGEQCSTESPPKSHPSSRAILGNGTMLGSFSGNRCASGWSFVFDPAAEASARWRRTGDRPANGGGVKLTLIRGTLAQCGQTCGKVLAAGGKEWALYSAAPEVTGFLDTASGNPTSSRPAGSKVTLVGSSLASATKVTFLGGTQELECSATSEKCRPDPNAPDSRLIVEVPPRHASGSGNVVVTTKPDADPLGPMISATTPANLFTITG